ncbi:MAG: hypothetical protein WBL23_02430 [Salinisphaera sp.]|uniref:hypothetical protein n=1 Tax=Salinisphaera sp. TaxID=1914330 RepID=UPI003C7B708B
MGTSLAADYASQHYGHTNKTDAGRARPATPDESAAPRTPTPSARFDLPDRGQTMASVRAEYGSPHSSRGPVGKPPITRWNYEGYHVYFEGNRVIHTVIPSEPEPPHHVDQLQTVHP